MKTFRTIDFSLVEPYITFKCIVCGEFIQERAITHDVRCPVCDCLHEVKQLTERGDCDVQSVVDGDSSNDIQRKYYEMVISQIP